MGRNGKRARTPQAPNLYGEDDDRSGSSEGEPPNPVAPPLEVPSNVVDEALLAMGAHADERQRETAEAPAAVPAGRGNRRGRPRAVNHQVAAIERPVRKNKEQAAKSRGTGDKANKNWASAVVFTLFLERIDKNDPNPDHPVIHVIETPQLSYDFVSYLIYQPERGKDFPHLLHWQGYLEMTEDLRIPKAIQNKVFGGCKRVSIRRRKGTQQEAIAYAQKSDTRAGPTVVYGTPGITHQGERSDLSRMISTMVEDINRGEDVMYRTLFGEHRNVAAKHLNYVKEVVQVYDRKMNEGRCRDFCEVFALCGHTGVGKTHTVARVLTGASFYKLSGTLSSGGNIWFQDYRGQEILWLDECVQHIAVLNLLEVLDKWELKVNKKNSHSYARWRIVMITSNFTSGEWFKGLMLPTQLAIDRRIKQQLVLTAETTRDEMDSWVPPVSDALKHLLPAVFGHPFVAPLGRWFETIERDEQHPEEDAHSQYILDSEPDTVAFFNE